MPIGPGHPRGYRQRQLRELLTLEYGGSLPDGGRHGGDVPVLGSNGIVGSHSKPMVDRPGIVVGRKGSIGKVTWVDRPFWPIDTTYFVDPKTTHSQRWLYYLLDSLGLDRLNSATGVPGLNRDDAYVLKVPVPDEATSEWIAGAIDAVDAAIDATRGVIEQTRRLKTAVLQDLLTRGLPGRHSEFREVKGLGQVPRAWKHTHIRELCTDIIDCPHTTPNFVDAGVPVIRTSAVRDGILVEEELTFTSASEYEKRTARLVPEPGDIVFTREAPVGEAFVIPNGMRLSLGQRTMLLRPDPTRLDPHFFVSLLYEPRFRRRLLILAGGSTNPHLNVAEVRDLSIATPPIAEQRQITRSLNSLSDRIANSTSHFGQLMQLKTALSQALLTGRVRVPANTVEAV